MIRTLEQVGYVVKHVAFNTAVSVMTPRGQGEGIGGDPVEAAAVLQRMAPLLVSAGARLRDAVVVELGPGRSTELSAACVLTGAREALLVDTDLRVPADARDPRRYSALPDALAAHAPDFLHAAGGATIADLEERLRRLDDLALTCRAYSGDRLPVEAGSVDLILSKSVLEHVAPGDVRDLLADQARALRPGGVAVHLIDLRDHTHIDGDDGANGDWLEALQWPEPLFRAMFSRRATAINRLRLPEWRGLFSAAGLEIAGLSTRSLALAPEFRRDRLNARWRGLDDATLSVAWIDVALRRPLGQPGGRIG